MTSRYAFVEGHASMVSSQVGLLSLRQLRQELRLSSERMGRLVDVSAKTIERWEEREALPASIFARGRLAKMQEIVQLGLLVYTADGFNRFLNTPAAQFGGCTALQLIERGQADQVLAALAADYEGLGY